MDTQFTDEDKRIALLQAFLFHYGEPISSEKANRAIGFKKDEFFSAVDGLKKDLTENPRAGLTLIDNNGELQLVTKPEFQDARKRIIEEEWKTELTPAGRETLSLVAYLGPVSKMMVDYVRGVNSGFTLRNLLLRGLVEREPSKKHPHSFDYHVSSEFLRHMGMTRVEDLPDYDKYHKALEQFAVATDEPQSTNSPEAVEEITSA